MSARLRGLAYRMLGCVADAEDVVQEAALRLHTLEQKPESEEAYLYTVVSRLCIDKLRRQKVERKHYFGPWLPEPLPDEWIDPIEMQQDMDIAMMCLLDHLTPAERVVFVLREAFEFSYAELGDMLNISQANARQRYSRAAARLKAADTHSRLTKPGLQTEAQDGDKRLTVQSLSQQEDPQFQMLQKMLECVANADLEGLQSLMTSDVVALTDGGGVVSAAIAPIYEPKRIAQVTLFLVQKSQQEYGDLEFEFVRINGDWAILIRYAHGIHSCTTISMDKDRINCIYVWRNPHKLAHL